MPPQGTFARFGQRHSALSGTANPRLLTAIGGYSGNARSVRLEPGSAERLKQRWLGRPAVGVVQHLRHHCRSGASEACRPALALASASGETGSRGKSSCQPQLFGAGVSALEG